MRLKWGVAAVASLLASSALAQLPMWRAAGTWHTDTEPDKLVSMLITKDQKHALVISNENGRVTFGIESPRYLKAKEEKLKAMVRFDSDIPRSLDFRNVDQHMAVVSKEKAPEIIKRLAAAKRMRVRMANLVDAHCWELAFFDITVDLPSNTPQVLGKVLQGPG